MISYVWRICAITKKTINGVDGVIFNVVWEKSGIDYNGHTGTYKTAMLLDTSEIDPNNFVPYENLTQDIMVEWIKSIINEEEVDRYIKEQIQRSKDKEVEILDGNLPWQINENLNQGLEEEV